MEKKMLFDSSEFSYSWWNGQRLLSSAEAPISFDLETEKMRPYREPLEGEDVNKLPLDPLHVPRTSLAMAYDFDSLYLIHPSKTPAFFSVNRGQRFVGQNLQFDISVIMKHYDASTREILWKIGDNNGYSDTMILDMLLQLGTGKLRHEGYGKATEEAKLYPTDLGTLSLEYGCGELDKGSEYRLRFGELLGLSEEQIDAHPEAKGFYEYALADVIATYRLYKKQRVQGLALMTKAGWSPTPKKLYEIRPDAVEKFGVLSECLQTKASIVLAELSRTPLRIDQKKREVTEQRAREDYEKALATMLETDPGLIKRFKSKKRAGEIKRTKTTLLPQFDQKCLVKVLEAEAEKLQVPVIKSEGKTKATSTSAKVWIQHEDRSPFIAAWANLEKTAKLLEFLTALNAPAVYSNYRLLMMNGRTSTGAFKNRGRLLLPSINIQQIPRDGVRDLFIPPAGYKWFSCDYSYVELRTLAAVCRAKFGWSKLGEAIEEHTAGGKVDPHQRTAAMLADLSLEEFFKLDKAKQKELRQKAKACNFGYSGGLGAAKLGVYAKTNYGVNMSIKEAKLAKKVWLDTYPEMKEYLADPSTDAMEWQTGRKIPAMDWFTKKRLSDYLRGDKKVRATFKQAEVDDIWDFLEMLAYAKKDEEAIADAERRKVTTAVCDLLSYRACTLTGRIRNNTKYTDGANCPFSGLAADGAKLALWNLMRNGFQLISFIHDAIDVVIDPKKEAAQTRAVKQIMIDSMQYVVGQGVPVAAEGEIGDCWSKA